MAYITIPGWVQVARTPGKLATTSSAGDSMKYMTVHSATHDHFLIPITGEPGDDFLVLWTTFNGEGWDRNSVRATWEDNGWEVVTTTDGEDCDGRLRTTHVHHVTANEQALGGVLWKLLDSDRDDELAQEAGY